MHGHMNVKNIKRVVRQHKIRLQHRNNCNKKYFHNACINCDYSVYQMCSNHANIPCSRFGFKISTLHTVAFLYKATQYRLAASNVISSIHSTEFPDVSVLESNWKFRVVCFTFNDQLYAYVTSGDRT
jgi:hypothetical protein